MDHSRIYINLLVYFYSVFYTVRTETYNVKIGTEHHLNVVDKNFLSFTVDPKHLFSTSEKYNSKDHVCMASSLAPAYLRIAGPSTAHMSFQNSTITIDETHGENKDNHKKFLLNNLINRQRKRETHSLKVTADQWRNFARWAQMTGFDIVFALNNAEKTASGTWDTNTALNILTVAEEAEVGDIYWQLGYECSKQSIDEYLNDLQTLSVIVESLSAGEGRGWRAAGGDVTGCLQEDSRSDFKDYVTLSLDMMDAVMLNGNSTSHELERMSAGERIKLLTSLHSSPTPLWLTERAQRRGELARAADWLASLGLAAANGFSVHFRELLEEELYRPTLSFYMALLFKNLVGERVLPVDIDASQATLFAHCTSLRRKPVPGAVTLYGANMDDEPARLSLKLSKREEGGEIMQFILGHDSEGNIVVNGKEMAYEGDIRPVVKRVGPYKTLLINLPAKSFGFWVLSNTKVEACRDLDSDGEKKFVEAEPVTETNNENKLEKKIRMKRFVKDSQDVNEADLSDGYDCNLLETKNKDLKKRIDDINTELKNVHSFFRKKSMNKTKRQTFEDFEGSRKLRRQLLRPSKATDKKERFEDKPILNLIDSIFQLARKNDSRITHKMKRPLKLQKLRVNKESPFAKNDYSSEKAQLEPSYNKISRSRRSIVTDKYDTNYEIDEDAIKDNEINVKDKNNKKMWKVLKDIQDQLNKISIDIPEKFQSSDDSDVKSKESDNIIVKTEITDGSATINLSEKPNHGLIKTTFENVFSVLSDLNRNLNRFWEALSFFE